MKNKMQVTFLLGFLVFFLLVFVSASSIGSLTDIRLRDGVVFEEDYSCEAYSEFGECINLSEQIDCRGDEKCLAFFGLLF